MIENYSTWYDQHYHEMSGNGIWFRGGELNALDTSEFLKRKLRVLITRLSTYVDTADSFTHKLLYQIITSHQDIFADMAYLPPIIDAELFFKYEIPWLTGTSSKISGQNFNVIAFSNSIVEELLNIPSFLKRSGIPLRKQERLSNEAVPLIILGGANALYTSALCVDDPLVDAIFVGEEPSSINELFKIVYEGKKENLSKRDILQKLESIGGLFQPEKKTLTQKFTSVEITTDQLLKSAPVLFTEEQMGTGNLQISEGCPCFCSFCAESWGRKPYRELSAEKIRKAAFTMKASMGLETMELYSFNFNMHHEFYEILRDMSSLFSTVGLKSQRFDTIAAEPELIKCLHAVGKTSITCGLEGMSARLRKYLHKSLDEQELKHSLSILIRAPLRELKIFLIATGKETKEDFDEFCLLLRYINETMIMVGRRPRIIFSMTALVRFPYTPLESEDAAPPSVCREIMLQTERVIKSRGFEFRDSADINDYYISQMLVRVQDKRVAEGIFKVVQQSDFVYYREITPALNILIEAELKKHRIFQADLLKGSSSTISDRQVQINVNESFLQDRAKDTETFTDNGYCLGSFEETGKCQSCGACENADSTASIVAIRKPRTYSAELLRKKVKERQESITISFRVNIPFERRGLPRKNCGIALARAVMLSDRRLIEPFSSYSGSFVNDNFDSSWIDGDDILTLSFTKESQKLLEEISTRGNWISEINKHLISWGEVLEIHTECASKKIELLIESLYPFKGDIYFRNQSLKYMSRKIGENHYSFDFVKETLKKKVIGECTHIVDGSTHIVKVCPLEKFNFKEFIGTAFDLQSENDSVRIKVKNIFK